MTAKRYNVSVKDAALSEGQLTVSLGDLTAPLGLPMSDELRELLSLKVTALSTYYHGVIKGTGFRAQIVLGGSQSNPTTIEALSAVVVVDNTQEDEADDSDDSDDSE